MLAYFAVIWKWKWLILGGSLVVAVGAFLVALRDSSRYEASATLLATPSGPPAIPLTADTLPRLMMLSPVIEEAFAHFRLGEPPYRLTRATFRAAVVVKPIRNTGLVTLTVTLPDPSAAAAIVNFIAEKAVAMNAASRGEELASTHRTVDPLLDEAKRKREAVKVAIEDLERQANLDRLRAKRALVSAERRTLLDVARALATEQVGIRARADKLRSAQTGMEDTWTSAQVRGQILEAEAELASIGSRRRYIEDRLGEVEKKNRELDATIVMTETKLEDLNKSYQSASQAYEQLTKRLEAAAAAPVPGIALKLMDRAATPAVPVNPSRGFVAVMAGAVTCLILACAAFLIEFGRRSSTAPATGPRYIS